ncbi:hypothetical protein [Jannaschia aquimarina]|nr:hypothetical protein [Jannaschia aquimarina]
MATAVIGALLGAFTARRRKGVAADVAQWAIVWGIIGGLLGMVILIFISRQIG